ncbi:tRNA (adenosine(37)-N6)-threonylcarbamoyltransferase complex dimerization subunit type 1 TsaB [Undibacterium fentianense]|uniref:tRNA (Adenosine(37)-N6)-threonylcarbamoyltransferase complex dimerization subunit type 1 TsaB n=1 Tax=Undibacterium fentianense TaxID=2828728 RepID=A0A941E0U2_9BURK|nr:tRNA (adenosine(37)-N6)-threonylcarbamoyltransferase complex dimerization subunit type 1 TsaB [Undibacterium fentianense]MBR7798866.1 tRNA (adenosine(37)-N6)-threonylcarbamoyltransferase complex dimerization subunit type 1 TsaB [Undibacterium fentianense]
MKTIIAIETSTDVASVALLSQSQIFKRTLAGVSTHSFGLLPAIQEILGEAQIDLRDVDALAFGCGPGAFTGVRTACGVVQGLAFGLDKPVLPIVSLIPMAEAARRHFNVTDVVCCLDARMNEVYSGHYQFDGMRWQLVGELRLGPLAESENYSFERKLPIVLGTGLTCSNPLVKCLYESPSAEFILPIAKQALFDELICSPAMAQPLYLRNKVALTTLERESARTS